MKNDATTKIDKIVKWIPFRFLREFIKKTAFFVHDKITSIYLNTHDTNTKVANIEAKLDNSINPKLDGIAIRLDDSINPKLDGISSTNNINTAFLLNKLKETELKEKIRSGKKAKVYFLVSYISKFGMESIYQLMAKSDLFEPCILVHSARDLYFDSTPFLWDEFLESYDYFKQNGYETKSCYDFETKQLIDFVDLDIDIIFYVNPNIHEYSLIKNLRLNYHYLTCFINYGMRIIKGRGYHYDNKNINTAWKNFVESNYVFQQHALVNGAYNAVVTGYSKLDLYKTDKKDIKVPEKLLNGKKTVIWAPHWTLGAGFKMGVFLEYYKYFLDLFQKHPDINFVYKPHPDLIYMLSDAGENLGFTLDDYKAFLQTLESMENVVIVAEKYKDPYIYLFMISDLLITDCGSFIGEWLPSQKPCIFLLKEGRDINTDYDDFGANILSTYHICHHTKELTDYFNTLMIDNKDENKEDRMKILERDFITIGSTGEKIVSHLEKILKN